MLISVLWLCKLKQEEERINQGETPWTSQGIVMAVSKRVGLGDTPREGYKRGKGQKGVNICIEVL